MNSNSLGIYIHIPYCRSKCPYCDFFSMRGNKADYIEYVDLLKNSVKYWSGKTDKTVDTIYLGGGTPSVLGADSVYEIIKSVKEYFNVTNNAEITMEANPSSGKFFDFEKVKEIGLNRVSLGIQSANSNELKKLGRIHSREDVINTIELIKKAGIDNISLDIMLGIPEQSQESLRETIDFCVNTEVKHISSYILKLEENTFFYKNQDRYNFPDEDMTSDLYLYSIEYLRENGFNQYEISNFSKPGFESRHNLKYWNLNDYLGIGAAAHSFLDGRRFYYGRSVEDFKNNIIINDGIGGTKEEYIMLKLRLKSGLSLDEYKKAFGEDVSKDFLNKINIYNKAGYLDIKNDSVSFSDKGFLVSNSIISELI